MNLAVGKLHFNDNAWKNLKQNALDVVDLFVDKDVLSMASSIAYYTVLSLTPFLLLFFGFLAFIGWRDVPMVRKEILEVLGPSAAVVLSSMQDKLQNDTGAFAFGIFGVVTLLISATGVISQLQNSLDLIFELKPTVPLAPQNSASSTALQPAAPSPFRSFIRSKLISVLILLICVGIAAISLALTLIIQVFLPFQGQSFWNFINLLGSFLIFTAVFTGMFHFMPQKTVPKWNFCIKAGVLCSVLFHLGKSAMAAYFGHSGIQSSYGALSSFVIFLLWAYYNSVIILASACFARVFFHEEA